MEAPEGPQVDDRAAQPFPGIAPELGPLLRAVQRLTQRSADLADHMRAASEVNTTDFRALTHVQRHPGITAGELGELLDRSPAAVSTVVDRLVEVGHLERRRDESDRRRVRLWVTDQPRRVAATALAPMVERLAHEFGDDDTAEREALAAGLDRLTATLDSFLDTGPADGDEGT